MVWINIILLPIDPNMPYLPLGTFFIAFFLYGSFGITSSKFAPNITKDGTLDKKGPFPF
jgi:hypothetical protein